MNTDQELNAREARRIHANNRAEARLEKREAKAEKMIGELCREGRTVHYVFPVGGKYREGSYYELVCFLIRNNYA